ncbi:MULTISPECIES: DUF6286 domain-containing protein [unclassified Streptomyces]|uniref:DUF6286 domain-containing protein n=1 Tax=unclassified Streptomyces TaxID=2593676 RepID=UPI000DBAB04C|nr:MULTISPECIES: DUF6286 domain-containing protein [unclassified Streptomyces]MYT69080.1 Asp23/Gls24 family envelope stress response protein [Streptomyces sp. SID8367]RAJ82591.1 hypothetical protein K377_04311 [Streptomyces sp. PsTaAH-137]
MTAAAGRGTTVVSERAVRKIAERAAVEAAPTGIRPAKDTARGTATVRGRRADVALEVALPCQASLSDTVRRLQSHVSDRTRELTGLHVDAPRVGVTALLPARPGWSAPVSDTPVPAGRMPLRWWSPRRLPAGLLTLVLTVLCGALALDLVLVHLAHRPAAPWRTESVHWLTGHGSADPAVRVVAGLLAVLGLGMVVLALAPGRRGLLTVSSSDPRVRAAVDRAAVALLVRDAVGDVPGIGPVRVRVGRRRATVRARLAFGPRDTARDGVREAARGVLDSCALRRPLKLRVRVRPDDSWEPADRTTKETSADAS